MFTGISANRISNFASFSTRNPNAPPSRRGKQTYIVRFKQLTGIGSPGLYPRCCSKLPMGSWPLSAVASVLKKENSATAGSHGLLREFGLEDMALWDFAAICWGRKAKRYKGSKMVWFAIGCTLRCVLGSYSDSRCMCQLGNIVGYAGRCWVACARLAATG